MFLLEWLGVLLTLNELMVLAMFLLFIAMLFQGVPVAFALVGISLIFALFAEIFLDPYRFAFRDVMEFDRTGISYQRLAALPGRLFGSVVKNPVLVALPLFIFMGLMLDQSGVAQRMMHAMQKLFGALRGGLALTVLLIGIILAASTGVIGASVPLLGVMAIPATGKALRTSGSCPWITKPSALARRRRVPNPANIPSRSTTMGKCLPVKRFS